MARDNAKEKCTEEQPDEEDETLSLCDLPLNQIKNENPHFLFDNKPKSADADFDFDFDFGSVIGFGNSAGQPPPEMCLADDIFYQGQLLPIRLSVSSDTSSAARNSRSRVLNLFHSHPSPKPQIKSSPETLRRESTGRRSQKFSTAWDFIRVGVVKAPVMLELNDLKHRSSMRRNSSVSRSNGGEYFIPATVDGGCGSMRRPRERESTEWKNGGILSGVGCKCSVESTVAPAVKTVVVRRKNGVNKNIPAAAAAMRQLRIKKEKEQQEKLVLSRQRTFEWLKELSHATFPCEA